MPLNEREDWLSLETSFSEKRCEAIGTKQVSLCELLCQRHRPHLT